MQIKDLLENVNVISTTVKPDMLVSGICYDTRKLKIGDVFVAVKGYETDGHKYIDFAMENGAVCVICQQAPETKAAIPCIVVDDSRKALALISASWFGHPAKKMKIIGATGTNGKTTVTTLLKSVIENVAGAKTGLIGTSGVWIGSQEHPASFTTPESYELHELFAIMADSGCKYVVMEVSSHALYLSRVYGIEFDVGVYTNLSQDHLDFHGTMEKYAEAKSVLFAMSKKSAVNIDDEYAQTMLNSAAGEVLTYAVKNDLADLVGKNVKLYSDRVSFCILMTGKLVRVEVSIPGMFSVYNTLCVVSAALLLGLDIDTVAGVLPDCKGVKGRAEVVPTDTDYTVLIDYAHTPDALEKIIAAVRGSAKGRVVTLFGCGGDRDRKKRPLMGAIAVEKSDFTVITSDNPRTEAPGAIIDDILSGVKAPKSKYIVIENRRDAIWWVLKNAKMDDVIILAGKGHETYQILGKEKIPFDEREVIAQYFETKK